MKNVQKIKQEKQKRKKNRVRIKTKGTSEKPRLSVFRSNKHIYAQIINDEKGHTLVAASNQELTLTQDQKKDSKQKKIETAFQVGELIAQKALEKKIKKVVFDRGKYKYHGRVKAIADGAKKKGLEF